MTTRTDRFVRMQLLNESNRPAGLIHVNLDDISTVRADAYNIGSIVSIGTTEPIRVALKPQEVVDLINSKEQPHG